MKNYINIFLIGVISLLILMNSCKGDDIIVSTKIDKPREYNAPIPLVSKYRITLKDILGQFENDQVNIDDDGLLNFMLVNSFDVVWDDLAVIKDIALLKRYTMDDCITNGNDFNLVEKLVLEMNPNSRFDKAEISQGTLDVVINVPVGYVGDITLKSPMFAPLISKVFYADGINSANYVFSFDTKDKTLLFNTEEEYAVIPVELESSFDAVGDLNDQLTIIYAYRDVETRAIYGYFGQKTINLLSEEFSLADISGVIGDAKLNLKEIKYTLNIENQIGVPFDVTATNLKFYEKSDDVDYKLLMVEGESKVSAYVDAATHDNSVITPAYGKKEVTNLNSNILEIASPVPAKVNADIFALANPNGDIAGTQNFIHETDTLFGNFEISAPLWFSIENYDRNDTIAFDFNELLKDHKKNVELINYAKIYIDIDNTLPFDINSNIYAIDADGKKIDDIFSDFEEILLSGEIENDKVTKPGKTKLVAELNNTRIAKYFDEEVMNLVLETKASTPNQGVEYAKIYENYGLDLKISFEVKFKIPLEELSF